MKFSSPLTHGVFTISVGLELAWGMQSHLNPRICRAIRAERGIVQRLLSLFSRYAVSATWAVVGHLLVPQTNEISFNSLWYGADILDMIKKSLPPQEIGCHSFAHMLFDEKKMDPEVARLDIQTAKRVLEAADIPFEVFVFPKNLVGFTHLLAANGIRVYRGCNKHWYDIPLDPFWMVTMFLNFLMAMAPPVVMPTIDEHGMVNIPDSMLLLGRNGVRSLVPPNNLIKMGVGGLDHAVKNKKVFHLWFHPSNFAYQMDTQFQILERILEHAHMLRQQGALKILTMGEVARIIRQEAS